MILRFNILIIFLGLFIAVHALSSLKVDLKICRKRNGLFPKPGSLCKAYYQCTKWVPEELICPPDQHFNTINGECDWMNRFPCFEKPQRKECPRANGRFLKPGTGCVYFYDCCNGEPTEKKCPQDQIFDPLQEKCQWKEHSICSEDVSTDDSRTSMLFTTLEPSTLGEVSESLKETHSTESKYPLTSVSPTDSSTVSDFDHATSKDFEITASSVSESVFTLIQTTSKESFLSTDDNVHTTTPNPDFSITIPNNFKSSPTSESESEFPDTQESTVGKTISTPNASPTSFIKETTPAETFKTAILIEETTPDEIIQSTILIKETTPEVVIQSTLSIRETTSDEIVQSTSLIRETTPGEIVLPTSLIRETTPEEIAQSTTSNEETTPDKMFQSTALFRETVPEEIVQSTTSIRETTLEDIHSTTSETDETITMTDDRGSLSTSDVGEITNEPDIFCPEPFGYFPHPTNKHKFVGCVDNIPNVLECPSDLIYNHKRRQCVYQ